MRRLVDGSVLVAVGLLGLAACEKPVPRAVDLKAALSDAQKAGLPLTQEDAWNPKTLTPESKNASAALLRAMGEWQHQEEAYEAGWPAMARNTRVVEGRATKADRVETRQWIVKRKLLLRHWRRVSEFPLLDLDPNWRNEFEYEMPHIRYGVQSLLVAAAMEDEPRANVVAAARLISLLRTMPGPKIGLRTVQMGRECLTFASRLKLRQAADQALGPAPDFRTVLRPLLPKLLDSIRADRTKGPEVEARALQGWTELWRALPADGRDYEGAAHVLDARLPALEELGKRKMPLICFACAMQFVESHAADALREIDRFEKERHP